MSFSKDSDWYENEYMEGRHQHLALDGWLDKKGFAAVVSDKAQKEIRQIEESLQSALALDHAITWDALIDRTPFSEIEPAASRSLTIMPEPKLSDVELVLSKKSNLSNLLERCFPGLFHKIVTKLFPDVLPNTFKKHHSAWCEEREKMLLRENERTRFLNQQRESNAAIERYEERYLGGEVSGIIFYCKQVLLKSPYPDAFPKRFDLGYTLETKSLIVEYSLPNLDALPTTKEVKYIAVRDEFSEVKLSEKEIHRLYDVLLYQIALRSIYELYQADQSAMLQSIVFNGWVESIDKATGKNVNTCVLSLQAGRKEFLEIDLARVDAKSCFRSLKGIGSSQLHSMSAVAPIMMLNKEDRRFVPGNAVSGVLDDSFNLAAMDWEDFEHLIRELFAKEFAQYGGDVKVTRASRDGGVDAIAFDPDPIRGGKIVIQAKRYTNTVGVSAVRDLYGTVLNEGASKGILVTTSHYGPDAYEFAKGKPLTLLEGGHLLHLLEKHGHKARIDLKEAKKHFADNAKEEAE